MCAAITQVGPNSILQVSVLCDRLRARNTKHPSLVSTSLPPPLLPLDSLFSLLTPSSPSSSSTASITSSSTTGEVWREMAARGDLTLQALGVDINSQVVSLLTLTNTNNWNSISQNEAGQTLLHLAAGCAGRQEEVVESLVRAGARLHITDTSGLTPLMLAVLQAGSSTSLQGRDIDVAEASSLMP